MRVKDILNRIQKFKSFVYEDAEWDETEDDGLRLIVTITPRRNSRPICSGCEKAGTGLRHHEAEAVRIHSDMEYSGVV